MRDFEDLGQHDMVIQYLASMSKSLLHEYVIFFQNLITINIISCGPFNPLNIELIESAIQVLDIFHWINYRFKEKQD